MAASAPPTPFKDNRVYAAAHFQLEIDGLSTLGLIRSVEGGSVKADVITYQGGGTQGSANERQFRQLGKPKYDDLKLQVGMALAQPFYDWVSNFFTGTQDRRDGAIAAGDFYYKERARRKFTGALIKDVTFPKLDAQDKSPVYLSVGLSIETLEFVAPSGNPIKQLEGMPQQRNWTANNFSLYIAGMDAAVRRCSKIDAFTVKQNIAEYQVGGSRQTFKMPTQFDFPTISFYVPEADAKPLYDSLAKGVIGGAQTNALNGAITMYDQGGAPIGGFSWQRGDITAITPDKSDATSEDIKMVKVDLFVEGLKFKVVPAGSPLSGLE